jgi:hypothetical protein
MAIEAAPELLESSYGWLSLTAEIMKRSKATGVARSSISTTHLPSI